MKTNLKDFSLIIRTYLLEMLQERGYGHLGGSMSIVELLSVLYGKHMNINSQEPHWDQRDYLILSKGHAGPALYATLAAKGFFEKDLLFTLNDNETNLPSHTDRLRTPGIDMTNGSLGQGSSVAAGIAYDIRLSNSDQKVFVIVGDGELNEGQCWEAFQFIAHQRLDNLIVFIDENKKQLDDYTSGIIESFDLTKKMEAFGFYTQYVKGDDEHAIDMAIEKAFTVKNQALCIVLDTIKGQGMNHFEEMKDNHSPKFGAEDNQQIDAFVNSAYEHLKEQGYDLSKLR